MSSKEVSFDYIIAGSGCAGLSLLYRIIKEPTLSSKKVLVIDKEAKTHNDRTWCFWENEPGLFESIVHHQWQKLLFHAPEFSKQLDLKNQTYKMIQGIDFYNYVLEFAKTFTNVFFTYENIENIECNNDCAVVKTHLASYSAPFVFNSTHLFHPKMTVKNSLLQHFEGWVIKTKKPFFDETTGTLMDFRLNQKNGATFMYVLPTSPTEALVEYTLFSPELLDKHVYKKELKSYIKDYLAIEDYDIVHEEFGVIPMSLADFPQRMSSQSRIINIGTAGGFTKASSGYTFQFIQKNSKAIVDKLKAGKAPVQKQTFRDKMFQWYDYTLLDVLLSNKMTGKAVFSTMFKKLSAEKILLFLNNESSIFDELKIVSSLPIIPFLTSGIKQLKRSISAKDC